jgi:uncharacterized membrane protein YkoI
VKRLSLVLALSLLGLAVLSVAPTDAQAESDKPPVSIIQARKVALARVPGTIVNEKLKNKKQKKDKPPVWSIKIRARGVAADSDQLVKIEIDANTGTILKVKDVRARKPDAD